MGVAAHIYLEQGSCQLPSICRSCSVEHPTEWIITSARCIRSLYLKEADRCKTALIEFIFEFSPFFRSFISCMQAILCVTSEPWARNFCYKLWSMNETVDLLLQKPHLRPIANVLYRENDYLKKSRNFGILVDCSCVYVDCIIGFVNLFSECSNRLCFLVHPLTPNACIDFTIFDCMSFPDIRNTSDASLLLCTHHSYSCSWIMDSSRNCDCQRIVGSERFFPLSHFRIMTEFWCLWEPFVSIRDSFVFSFLFSFKNWKSFMQISYSR